MNSYIKADILGCQVDLVDSRSALERIKKFIEHRQHAHVITLNAEIVYEAQDNQELKTIINHADMVTPDGIGIVWGGRQLGHNIKERVTGIDLLYKICEQAVENKWKLYLLGASPGIADKAAAKLEESYPGLNIVGTRHGYFNDNDMETIIKDIQSKEADILFVALGAPRQEYWIREYKDILKVPVNIGVGGSFDVIAGEKKRAPQWMIKLNIEWLYRLISEPSRIKRQMALPKFAALIIKEKLKG